ncbi:hypothetical protein DPMN_149273 [Dreissena polymorpha]|uniref:Zinc finger PHD-type domain-containing protein n=1 Tax=Dreissena polymorpha TaxID=45954 RepID=A0A9D4FFK2_DREPO|nr:hypothetical protein DPMN_149273 [Dreissena polymorpha]
MQSKDIHPHPDPAIVSDSTEHGARKKGRQPKHPCRVCGRGVTSRLKAVDCDSCGVWTHIDCTGFITVEEYLKLSDITCEFDCTKCTFKKLPFNSCKSTCDSENNIPNENVNILLPKTKPILVGSC